MNMLILVVDDEPDVEILFRQQFRRDLRAGRFTMEFAQSDSETMSSKRSERPSAEYRLISRFRPSA